MHYLCLNTVLLCGLENECKLELTTDSHVVLTENIFSNVDKTSLLIPEYESI